MICLCLLPGTFAAGQPIVKISHASNPQQVREQVAWYLNHLDIHENIFLSVIFTERMSSGMDGMTYCLNADNPYPRLIIKVRIASRLREKQQELVLAHEMVHVKQYAKGELKVLGQNKVRWHGRIFRNRYRAINPRLSPWEREAYRTDHLIARLYGKQSDQLLLAETADSTTRSATRKSPTASFVAAIADGYADAWIPNIPRPGI